jgi:hypothetical protein
VSASKKLLKANPKDPTLDESRIRSIGEDLLDGLDPKRALPVFQLNFALHPKSSVACVNVAATGWHPAKDFVVGRRISAAGTVEHCLRECQLSARDVPHRSGLGGWRASGRPSSAHATPGTALDSLRPRALQGRRLAFTPASKDEGTRIPRVGFSTTT